MFTRSLALGAALATTAVIAFAGTAGAEERPPRAVPPAPAFDGSVKARTGQAAKKATRTLRRSSRARHRVRRQGVRARAAANGIWYGARGDCYSGGAGGVLSVSPGVNTLGAGLGETAKYRALLWNGYAWAAYPSTITFTRAQLNDGAIVNGYYVQTLPAQSFSIGRNQYQRAAIQVYYPSRGYSDWNWVQYTQPPFGSAAQPWYAYCYFP